MPDELDDLDPRVQEIVAWLRDPDSSPLSPESKAFVKRIADWQRTRPERKALKASEAYKGYAKAHELALLMAAVGEMPHTVPGQVIASFLGRIPRDNFEPFQLASIEAGCRDALDGRPRCSEAELVARWDADWFEAGEERLIAGYEAALIESGFSNDVVATGIKRLLVGTLDGGST
jgi:hypothetical protein